MAKKKLLNFNLSPFFFPKFIVSVVFIMILEFLIGAVAVVLKRDVSICLYIPNINESVQAIQHNV